MLDDDNPTGSQTPAEPAAPPATGAPAEDTAAAPTAKKAVRKTAAKKAAASKTQEKAEEKPPAKRAPAAKKSAEAAAKRTAEKSPEETADAEPKPAKRTRKTAAKKAAEKTAEKTAEAEAPAGNGTPDPAPARSPIAPLFVAPDASAAPAPRKRAVKKATGKTAEDKAGPAAGEPGEQAAGTAAADETVASAERGQVRKPTRRRSTKAQGPADDVTEEKSGAATSASDEQGEQSPSDSEDASDDSSTKRRPRRRGGRRRRKGGGEDDDAESSDSSDGEGSRSGDDSDDAGGSSTASRRRRRRRRSGDEGGNGSDDPEKTVTRVRKSRSPEDEITALSGSTRLEAKKQRRREGREAGRRRAPIVSEAEFLARREAVDRVMVVRQRDDLTQIGVLEDKVLVEHYVARESQTSLIGNVYLGRVQNVLPSMEAAFVDIGKGRNAVLYAGEVNWSSLGAKDNQPRKIESFLKSGQPVLVQVTKDPIGHKGARLTSQVSLPGRFLVYVPDGTTSGISRKLPENERTRLKTLLKEIVPDTAGVIVRTAAEGASEEELTQDVERLTARWSDIEAKVEAGQSPQLLYGEPDLTLKVVRDLFTEDFAKLVVQGDDAWDLVENYVSHVAPDLQERLERYRPDEHGDTDLFASYRLDEQIAKGLDRKVWLPSGGSLVIDRTEAMTVVDVNTGKFTGSGGNLEETVTKNNLEAAEEIVRQLRLRDIGGIIVIDFIDMVLESNRDLVLRRTVECLGRDRTRHQVAEVTSLGLVQMTRKRIGTGLLEAFSEECAHCKGRGLTLHDHPIESSTRADDDDRRGGRRGRGGRTRSGGDSGNDARSTSSNDSRGNDSRGNGTRSGPVPTPSPKDVAAVARPENADRPPLDEQDLPELPASDTAEDSAVQLPVTADSAVTETGPSAEPVGPAEPVEPVAPTVVTTRRRSARRAAGPPVNPPAEAAGESAGAEGGDSDPDEESSEDDSDGFVLHVPVKRKGARKR